MVSPPLTSKPITKEEAQKAEKQPNVMLKSYNEKVQQQQQKQERAEPKQ